MGIRTKPTKKQNFLRYFAMVPLFASVIILILLFPHGIPDINDVNPNIVNGLLTMSGIVFAFQPIIFRARKIFFYRFLFVLVFLFEGVLLTIVGYSFVSDAIGVGNFSGTTLYYTTWSLFSNIAFLVYLIFADLLVTADYSAPY